MAFLLRGYQNQLRLRPYRTQILLTAVLFGTGDTMAQQFVDRKGIRNQDWVRTARMVAYGGAIFGPIVVPWMKFLDARVVIPSSSKLQLAARVGLDQLVFAPAIIGVFLSTMATLEGGSPREKLDSTYATAVKSNWGVWPWVQVFNFSYVPLQHRVLTANVVSLFWNCYLSWLNNNNTAPVAADKKGNAELTWS